MKNFHVENKAQSYKLILGDCIKTSKCKFSATFQCFIEVGKESKYENHGSQYPPLHFSSH